MDNTIYRLTNDICPLCGNEETEWFDDTHDGEYHYEYFLCRECGLKWENEYVYVKTTIEEVADETQAD